MSLLEVIERRTPGTVAVEEFLDEFGLGFDVVLQGHHVLFGGDPPGAEQLEVGVIRAADIGENVGERIQRIQRVLRERLGKADYDDLGTSALYL